LKWHARATHFEEAAMTEQHTACTLTSNEQLDRRERWHRLRDVGHAVRIETDTGLRLEFHRSESVERELRELAALERDCCAFATWTVRDTGSRVVLEVDGQGDAIPVLHAMYGSFRATPT
jgi:hypothetical protein